MSDNKGYDDLLSGLEEEERPARSGQAKEQAARSEQRGPRADPGYTQVNANIPKELHASLFFYLKQEGRSLSSLVNELLEAYVEEQGGIITRKRKKK